MAEGAPRVACRTRARIETLLLLSELSQLKLDPWTLGNILNFTEHATTSRVRAETTGDLRK